MAQIARRSLLAGLGAAAVLPMAPPIVRAASLMPLSHLPTGWWIVTERMNAAGLVVERFREVCAGWGPPSPPLGHGDRVLNVDLPPNRDAAGGTRLILQRGERLPAGIPARWDGWWGPWRGPE